MSGIRPETGVVDEIDRLVSETMSHAVDRRGYPLDNYNRDELGVINDGQVEAVRCSVCSGEFHGLATTYGCPSEFGSDDEIAAYAAQSPSADGYALSDLFEMRSRGVGQFSYQEWFESPSGHQTPPPLQQFPRDDYRRPRVRFWYTDPVTGQATMIEGTLVVGSATMHNDSFTINALLAPPLAEWRVDPPQDRSGVRADPNFSFDEATSALMVEMQPLEAVTEPQPAGPLPDGRIAMEAITMGPEAVGFEPIGTISPDDLQITHQADYLESWGGRRIRTVHRETSIEFNSVDLDPDFFHRLLR